MKLRLRVTRRIKMVKSGVSLPTLLFVVFLVLKLCNVISWSWWLVTLPLWGCMLLIPLFFICIFIVPAIIATFAVILAMIVKFFD